VAGRLGDALKGISGRDASTVFKRGDVALGGLGPRGQDRRAKLFMARWPLAFPAWRRICSAV